MLFYKGEKSLRCVAMHLSLKWIRTVGKGIFTAILSNFLLIKQPHEWFQVQKFPSLKHFSLLLLIVVL